MLRPADPTDLAGPLLETHLLGRVEFEDCLALMRQLSWDVAQENRGRMVLLLCEHPALITVGHTGSRAHIRLECRELARQSLAVRWVNRGGGCVLHAPGQLAIHPLVPLAWHGWSQEEYLGRLQTGLAAALAQLGHRAETRPGLAGLWGRTGQIAALGVAVEHGVTRFGAYLNVNPAPGVFGYIDTARAADQNPSSTGRWTMSSLVAERGRPVGMSLVRSLVIQHLSAALGCGRFHLYTGHPLLNQIQAARPEATLRAS